MAGEPSRLISQAEEHTVSAGEHDAGYEKDLSAERVVSGGDQGQPAPDEEDSDVDAEGEEVDEDEEELQVDPVGAVKIPNGEIHSPEDEDEAASSESSGTTVASDAGTEASSEDSDVDNDWEAESDAAEVGETETVDPNRCIYCGEDEENDPSEEFELYLSCAVCGDNSHRQCARNANTLGPDDETSDWRCSACIEKGLEPDPKDAQLGISRRRSSAPKIARDLLPAHRGSVKPDSHSVFNTLILDDDPMDGSRSLRKRKSSVDESELPLRSTRKRRRPSGADSELRNGLESTSPTSNIILKSATLDDDEVEPFGAPKSEDESPRNRATRPRRTTRITEKPSAYIVKSEGISLIVGFRVNKERLAKILSRKPRKKRIRDRKKVQPAPEPEASHYPSIQTSGYVPPFFSFQERDVDDSKSKPYGGILSEAEADTSKTFPLAADRKRFEEARVKAEEDWKQKVAAKAAAEANRIPKPPSTLTKVRCINFGGYEIDTWYTAPYPEEFMRNRVLYICEFCLKYMNSDYVAWRHKLKCPAKHPPGDEIYRDGAFSFFEIDGRKNPVYCQNLCLLAKLFLGSKTLFYDVEPFLFYVMTENDEFGCHFVGYFSKEKRPSSMNNVSCILVLPIHQRRGFGHMLIDFSYLLTRVENKTGSPEKPLSDMGLVSYRSYWRLVLCYQLVNHKSPISIAEISNRTGMTADDVISSLEAIRALVRDPVTKTYAMRLDLPYFRTYIDNYEKKGYTKINPDALVWTPYVMNHSGLAHYEDGPPLHTVVQREGDDDGGPPPEEAKLPEKMNGEAVETADEADVLADVAAPDDDPDKENALTPRPIRTGSVSNPASGPSTPYPNGVSSNTPSSAIPPVRYEVFPPIPGLTARRRPGRPLSSARRRTGTPAQRIATGLGSPGSPAAASTGGKPPLSARRTRSKLAVMVNGVDGEGPDNGVDGSHAGPNGVAPDEEAERKASPDPLDGAEREADGDREDGALENSAAVGGHDVEEFAEEDITMDEG